MKNHTSTFPQMQLICGKDDLRPLMSYVKIDKNFVVATDAHKLVYYKTEDLFQDDFIEEIGDRSILVHREDWKSLYDCENFKFESKNVLELIHAKKRNELIKIEEEETIGKYPNWQSVIPNDNFQREKNDVNTIGLNPKLMETVQRCMDKTKGVKIEIFARNKAILIESRSIDCKGIGLIMPVALDEDIESIKTGL